MVAGRGRGAGRFSIFWSMGGTGFWRWHALRAFRNPAYRRLWVAIIVNGFAVWVSRLTVGWFVFDETGSALLTAISFTMQSAPGIVVAPFGGAVADRIDRRYVLAVAAAIKGLAAVGLAWVAVDGMDSAWPVIALLAVAGAMTSFELPASQALIPDVVGPDDAMHGIAVSSVGLRTISAVGALTGGYLLELYGVPTALATAAVLHWIAAIVVIGVVVPARPREEQAQRRSVFADVREGMRIMIGLPRVRLLLVMTLLVEVLCFSHASVLPVLARERLGLDESDLGTLTAMAGFGGLLGALALTGLSEYRRKGLLLLIVSALYGAAVMWLGLSSLFAMALMIIVGVGMMAALFDGLQWGLLQANVPDVMRGRVLGGWMLAVSFGWIGHGELGLVSDAIGVEWALALNGGLMLVVAAVALVLARSLREA